MPFGLLVTPFGDNLGDDIQSLAACRLMPRVDTYIDREKISEAQVPPGTRVIINGWFMHDTRFWPPHENIIPLFLAFHARPATTPRPIEWLCDRLLGPRSTRSCVDPAYAEYFSRHAPIGCRDEATMRAVEETSVSAFFSGCVTLTIRPRGLPKTDHVVFVDPFGPLPHNVFRPDRWLSIPKAVRSSARCMTHLRLSRNIQRRLAVASDYLDTYERAKLVITSRLHVALPCVALGTPVIFLANGHRPYRLSGFEKLIQPITVTDFLRGAKAGDLTHMASTVDPLRLASLRSSIEDKVKKFFTVD